jgi:hypothetical protein
MGATESVIDGVGQASASGGRVLTSAKAKFVLTASRSVLRRHWGQDSWEPPFHWLTQAEQTADTPPERIFVRRYPLCPPSRPQQQGILHPHEEFLQSGRPAPTLHSHVWKQERILGTCSTLSYICQDSRDNVLEPERGHRKVSHGAVVLGLSPCMPFNAPLTSKQRGQDRREAFT